MQATGVNCAYVANWRDDLQIVEDVLSNKLSLLWLPCELVLVPKATTPPPKTAEGPQLNWGCTSTGTRCKVLLRDSHKLLLYGRNPCNTWKSVPVYLQAWRNGC